MSTNPMPPVISSSSQEPAVRRNLRRDLWLSVGKIVLFGFLTVASVSSFMRARKRALCGLGEYRQIEAAKEMYALENSITNHITVQWADLTPYLKAGSGFVLRGGKDRIGNPIIIGLLHEPVRVNPLTKKALAEAADDTLWGPYS